MLFLSGKLFVFIGQYILIRTLIGKLKKLKSINRKGRKAFTQRSQRKYL
jgi:hypothetical protein